jgi:hypothetical protein
MYCKHLSGLGLDLEMRWKQAKLDLIIMEHSSEQSRYCWVSVIHGHLNIRSSRVSLAVQETSPILKEGPLPLKTVSVYLSKGQMLSEDGIQDVGFSGEASLLKAENRPKKKNTPNRVALEHIVTCEQSVVIHIENETPRKDDRDSRRALVPDLTTEYLRIA